jgi:hypothetical protein
MPAEAAPATLAARRTARPAGSTGGRARLIAGRRENAVKSLRRSACESC